MTTTPDALDAILLAKARLRTGICWDSWLRVDDVWSQSPHQTISCRACGNTICDAHAPNRADAIVAHKADHAIEILLTRREAFRSLEPLDQMFTLPATARELEAAGI